MQPISHQNDYQIVEPTDIIGKDASEYLQIVKLHQYKMLWTYAANCILGLWLIAGPFIFDYKCPDLVISDTACGALIILFESLALSPHRALLRWCTSMIAFWLLLAPLVFWSPTPAVYLIDTIIGCLLIVFSILIPGTPGKGGLELPGPDIPPHWTYNPSSWIRRWLGIALALLGFFISRYLAAHQLGYISHAWDPFFGDGTDKVTGSTLSHSFPISDAGFGSVAYLMEVIAGFMGDRARWRTAPFVAVIFAILVLPLGATSVILVIMQPVVVGAWCGLCLISAAGLLMSVPLTVHEAVAVGEFLLAAKNRNKNLWQIFWFGGTISGAGATDPDRFGFSPSQRWIASIQGVTMPWPILIQLAIGLWLMARPDILPFAGRNADCDHLLGAMIVTVGTVSSAEVTRIARYINVLLGILVIAAALIFARSLPVVFYSEFVSGIALIFASLPRGEIIERYGGWDKYVR